MYNGYTNYITWRVMHDYCNDLINASDNHIYISKEIEDIVRNIIYGSYHDIVSAGLNGQYTYDYAMHALDSVNWSEICELVNDEISKK